LNNIKYKGEDVINLIKNQNLCDSEIISENLCNAFGTELDKIGSDENRFSYIGREFDEEINLYYVNARYYDATIGRFINVDPIQDGWNWYVYCNNNPLKYKDPTGLFCPNGDSSLVKDNYVGQNKGFDYANTGVVHKKFETGNTKNGSDSGFIPNNLKDHKFDDSIHDINLTKKANTITRGISLTMPLQPNPDNNIDSITISLGFYDSISQISKTFTFEDGLYFSIAPGSGIPDISINIESDYYKTTPEIAIERDTFEMNANYKLVESGFIIRESNKFERIGIHNAICISPIKFNYKINSVNGFRLFSHKNIIKK